MTAAAATPQGRAKGWKSMTQTLHEAQHADKVQGHLLEDQGAQHQPSPLMLITTVTLPIYIGLQQYKAAGFSM